MKSPMVQTKNYIQDKDNYSDLQVLRSAAGWYVGTLFHGTEDGQPFTEPGSRDSGYFGTKGEAEAHLRAIENDGAPTRMDP